MKSTDLIIFDCDGVLIDSEIVVCRLVSEAMTRLGHPLRLDEVIRRFAGRPEPEMIAEIERDWGRPVPPEYFVEIRSLIADAYATELRAVPGVAEVLERIRIPICVASSSYPEKLKLGLETVGLYRRFAPNLVSATFVAQGKPAPDVYEEAARRIGVDPTRAIAIEDSSNGLRAAAAAGMHVIALPNATYPPKPDALALCAKIATSTDDVREYLLEHLPSPR